MIGELIGDWIKGILIDGIMGNLSGLFSTVNTKVGEIASDVGTTPQAWNSGIFNMLQSLSDTVIVPIAAAILAVIMCYDERFKKWRYDDLPILPQEWQYIIPAEKKGQFAVLRSLMERPDVTGLVCATDAGREGELIFRFVYQMAGCKKPFKCLWISSMEDAAIREGFAHLKPGADYDDLYQSALCRAQADWLVGINATRLFSILYHKTLTVGRVQTPTLNMLVDREAKISNFKKEKYHVVHIAAGSMEAASDRFMNPDDADATKTACVGAQAVCVSVKREKKTEQPPRLYDLTTLQREANRLFGFTAKQTLDYAQQLYEKKLLTYPRTDSQYLTDDTVEEENLICMYHKSDRRRTAANIRAALPDMDEDMAALARQTADKLDTMHDADFEARQFHFTDE